MEDRETNTSGNSRWSNFFGRKRIIYLAALVVFIGAVSAAAMLKASGNPSFCATCHIIKPYYESWQSGPLLAAKHGSKDVKCLDCHQQSIPEKMHEGIAYVTGNYKDPLAERDFSRQKCLSCHEKTWQQTVQTTQFDHYNPHNNHLGDVECNLCHKMHRQSEVYCTQCHSFPWVDKLGDGWKKTK